MGLFLLLVGFCGLVFGVTGIFTFNVPVIVSGFGVALAVTAIFWVDYVSEKKRREERARRMRRIRELERARMLYRGR